MWETPNFKFMINLKLNPNKLSLSDYILCFYKPQVYLNLS